MLSNMMNKKKPSNSEEELLALYNEEPKEYLVYSEENDNGYEEYRIVLDEEEEKEEKEEEQVEEEIIVEKKKQKPKKSKVKCINKIINIILIVIVVVLLLIITDVVLVKKFNKGPIFAIPVKTYDDGGTKEYYGLGYKVIKYNQLQGRRDTEIGTYGLKYNYEPLEIDSFDLAVEYNGDRDKTINKYSKKFVRISGLLKEYHLKDNTITIGYMDEDGKYSIDIKCNMATEKKELNNLELFKDTTIIGTIYDFNSRKDDQPIIVHVDNCFAEQ